MDRQVAGLPALTADLIEVYVDHPAGRVYATSYTADSGWSQVPTPETPEDWVAYAPLALAAGSALLAAKAAREASSE